jgi:acetyl-CoA acetyltransferase
MENLKNKVAIVGVGYTPQNRVPGRSALSYHIEAATNAIEDAGLKVEEIDGILTQSGGERPQVLPWNIAQALGTRISFCDQQNEWGATAGCMVFHAAAALVYGLANYVVCTYGESPVSMSGAGSYAFEMDDRPVFGWYGASASYAMAARRGMHDFGTGPETWSHIAVSQRKWANLNPRAIMHDKIMNYDDYYQCQYVVEPFRLFDICQVSNSGRAFVVTTAERARNCRHRPVYVLGVGQDHPGTNIVQSNFMTGPTGARKSGEKALGMAGIPLEDIDACEIYDCYTYTVEITMQDYGFFAPGEGKAFFANGRTGPGGELPVNTSGGLLSEAYQQGFTPLTEAVAQLQGNAGDRQLGPTTKTKEPKIILVSNNGGTLQTHSTVILSNEKA